MTSNVLAFRPPVEAPEDIARQGRCAQCCTPAGMPCLDIADPHGQPVEVAHPVRYHAAGERCPAGCIDCPVDAAGQRQLDAAAAFQRGYEALTSAGRHAAAEWFADELALCRLVAVGHVSVTDQGTEYLAAGLERMGGIWPYIHTQEGTHDDRR